MNGSIIAPTLPGTDVGICRLAGPAIPVALSVTIALASAGPHAATTSNSINTPKISRSKALVYKL